MSHALHCDRDGCDSWQREPGAAESFLTLSGGYSDEINHFCNLDCLLHWTAAHSTPTEIREIA